MEISRVVVCLDSTCKNNSENECHLFRVSLDNNHKCIAYRNKSNHSNGR